jgi:hypothetical protein
MKAGEANPPTPLFEKLTSHLRPRLIKVTLKE